MRRLRSVLFVPGTRPDRFGRALAAGADAVVFDLEDSVESRRKAEARETVARVFANAIAATGNSLRFIRVNAPSSSWWSDDLAAIRELPGVDGVVLPKAESADQVAATAGRASVNRSVPVIPLLETPRGVLSAVAIAAVRATLPVPALLFGAEDLTAQLGVQRTIEGEELLFARSQVVLAAATVGADALDAVFTEIDAPDDLRRDALRARALGFHGKMAIHPSQIGTIHDVFSPTAVELDHARRVVEAYEAALKSGSGVIRLDDKMVDAPVASRARKLVELADKLYQADKPHHADKLDPADKLHRKDVKE